MAEPTTSARRRDMRCPNCGASVDEEAVACSSCDADFSHPEGYRPVRPGQRWQPPPRGELADALDMDRTWIERATPAVARIHDDRRKSSWALLVIACLASAALVALALSQKSPLLLVFVTVLTVVPVAAMLVAFPPWAEYLVVEIDKTAGTVKRTYGRRTSSTFAPSRFECLVVHPVRRVRGSGRFFAVRLSSPEEARLLVMTRSERDAEDHARALARWLDVPVRVGNELGPFAALRYEVPRWQEDDGAPQGTGARQVKTASRDRRPLG